METTKTTTAGAPTTASSNENSPKWVDDERKFRDNMLYLAITALKLSERITEDCGDITPVNAKYATEGIKVLADTQYYATTVIDDFMCILEAGALQALDKCNPMFA